MLYNEPMALLLSVKYIYSPTFPRTFFAKKKSTWIYFLMKRFGHFMNLISLFFSEQIWSILLNMFADTLPCLSWGSGVHLGLQKLVFAIQNVCLSTFLRTFCWHFEIIINSQISLMWSCMEHYFNLLNLHTKYCSIFWRDIMYNHKHSKTKCESKNGKNAE